MPDADDLSILPADADAVRGFCGLVNLENTCYMNSVVQFLASCAPLRAELLIDDATIEQCQTLTDVPGALSLGTSLQRVINVLWSGSYQRVAPVNMQDAIWKQLPDFRDYLQHDAQELFVQVVADLAGQHQSTLFQGRTWLMLTCSNCHTVTESHANPLFNQLLLPLTIESRAHHSRKKAHPSCTLDECVEDYFAGELLEGYRCNDCGAVGRVTKQPQSLEMPQVLCISLVRYCQMVNGRRAKNAAMVRVPIDGFVVGRSSYRLRSVVVHHGSAMSKGHYSCYAYNDQAESWIHLNDEQVQRVDVKEVLEQEAFMLMYETESVLP